MTSAPSGPSNGTMSNPPPDALSENRPAAAGTEGEEAKTADALTFYDPSETKTSIYGRGRAMTTKQKRYGYHRRS
ncbi:hypothetical protein Bpla01_04530 [Burkholderia plantarii]|nr:hypothetical protein Bpla01_04530 [Burkholderia plantarii]